MGTIISDKAAVTELCSFVGYQVFVINNASLP